MLKEGKMFVPLRVEEEKSPKEYLAQEVSEDISLFSAESQKIIRKMERGEKLTPKEQSDFSSERAYWWKNKYGFPFDEARKDPNNKYKIIIAREEVLMRKYAPPAEIKAAIELQNRLFKAEKEGNEQEIARAHNEYMKKYPGQLEGIVALAGMKDFIKKSLFLDTLKGQIFHDEAGRKWKQEQYQDVTEYQFLITHFLIEAGKDTDSKEYLKNFWEASERIAREADPKGKYLERLHILRRGIVGQVASHKIFEDMGYQPKLSHPEDDSKNSTDMWTDSVSAVQVKNFNTSTPKLVKSDTVSYPSSFMSNDKKEIHFNELIAKACNQMEHSIPFLEKKKGKKVEGYIMVIPNSMIDFVTGEPAPELKSFFKKEIDNIEGMQEMKSHGNQALAA